LFPWRLRVALHRGRALERCDGDQEATYEQLRQRKVSQDRNAERSGARLQVRSVAA